MGFLDARHIKRRASWPVWSDSTTTPIRFQPMPKKAAVRLWHRARTSIARRASLVATAVLPRAGSPELRHRPARSVLCGDRARKANVCERTVATTLARLRKLGILHWVQRCTESWRDGRFVLDAGRSHESRAILATCSNLGKPY
jgi:hypothetical protein